MNEKQSLVVIITQIPRWVLSRAVQLIRLSAVDSTQHGIVVPLRIPLHGGVCGDYHHVQFVVTGLVFPCLLRGMCPGLGAHCMVFWLPTPGIA